MLHTYAVHNPASPAANRWCPCEGDRVIDNDEQADRFHNFGVTR